MGASVVRRPALKPNLVCVTARCSLCHLSTSCIGTHIFAPYDSIQERNGYDAGQHAPIAIQRRFESGC